LAPSPSDRQKRRLAVRGSLCWRLAWLFYEPCYVRQRFESLSNARDCSFARALDVNRGVCMSKVQVTDKAYCAELRKAEFGFGEIGFAALPATNMNSHFPSPLMGNMQGRFESGLATLCRAFLARSCHTLRTEERIALFRRRSLPVEVSLQPAEIFYFRKSCEARSGDQSSQRADAPRSSASRALRSTETKPSGQERGLKRCR